MTDLVLRKQQAPSSLSESVSWRVVLDTFLDARVDSEHTRRAYRRHVEDFFKAADISTVMEVTGPLLTSYRAALIASELSPHSQKQAIAAVRSFLRWSGMMRAHTFPLELLGETLRTPRASVNKPYSVLTEQEIRDVLASAAGMPRDFAILALMIGAGLRVSEVVTLDVADIREDGDGGALLYIRQAKGKKRPHGTRLGRREPIPARPPRRCRAHAFQRWGSVPDSQPVAARPLHEGRGHPRGRREVHRPGRHRREENQPSLIEAYVRIAPAQGRRERDGHLETAGPRQHRDHAEVR